MYYVIFFIPPTSFFLMFNFNCSSGSTRIRRRATAQLITNVAKIAVNRYFFVILNKVITKLDE